MTHWGSAPRGGKPENQMTRADSVTLNDFVRIVTSNGGSSRLATLQTIRDLLSGTNATNILAQKTISAGTYAIGSADAVIYLDTAAGSLTANLPPASSVIGQIFTVKKINTLNTGTVQADGADTIDGLTTYVLGAAALDFVTVQSDGANWHVIGA